MRRILAVFLALTIMFSGFEYNHVSADSTVPTGHYTLLDTGVVFCWGNTAGEYQDPNRKPGATYTLPANKPTIINLTDSNWMKNGITVDKSLIHNVQVRPYNPGDPNYDSFAGTGRVFQRNVSSYQPDTGNSVSDQATYHDNFYTNYRANVSILDQSYDSANGTVSFRYAAQLPVFNAANPSALEANQYKMSGRLDDFYPQLGYDNISDVPSEIRTPLEAAGSDPDNRGYAYFVPVVITYDIGISQDLGVSNFHGEGSAEMEPGQTYQATCHFDNHTEKDWTLSANGDRRIPLQINANGKQIISTTVDVPKEGIDYSFQFTVPEDYQYREYNLEAKLNMVTPRIQLEEKDANGTELYENNVARIALKVKPKLPMDLVVTKIKTDNFMDGVKGTVTVYFKNDSKMPVGIPAVPVRLLINGSQVGAAKSVTVGPNVESQVTFLVTPPANVNSFTVRGEINHSRSYDETTYSNNTKDATVTVARPAPPRSCTVGPQTWVEYRSIGEYTSGTVVSNVYEEIVHHVTVYHPDGSESSYTWIEYILIGYNVRFYSEVHLNTSVTPNPIKSGYGVDVTASTTVTTDYDRPASITNVQSVWAYFPDSPNAVQLQCVSGNVTNRSTAVTWRLPANSSSVLQARKHYIPVSWPDGNYKVTIIATDVGGPVNPCARSEKTIQVSGNMHEDDYSGTGQ